MPYLSTTAALKSLSTHGFPFRRLRRCIFWSERHRTTDGGAAWLARSSPLARSFDRLKPLLKRFAAKEYPPSDAHSWQHGDAAYLAVDDLAKVCARAPDERGCFRQIQDFGYRCFLGLRRSLGFIEALGGRQRRMRGGGGHLILRSSCCWVWAAKHSRGGLQNRTLFI